MVSAGEISPITSSVCFRVDDEEDKVAEAEKLMLEDYPITPMWVQVTKNLVDPSLTGWAENAQDDHLSRYLCRGANEEVSTTEEDSDAG